MTHRQLGIDEPAEGGARQSDPNTSHKSAHEYPATYGSQRHKAFKALCDSHPHSMTWDEISEWTGVRDIWKRVSELHQGGWIEVAGERISKASRKLVQAYVLSEQGRLEAQRRGDLGAATLPSPEKVGGAGVVTDAPGQLFDVPSAHDRLREMDG